LAQHASIIALEGIPVAAAAISLAAVFWVLGWHKAAAVATVLSVFVLWFFRNPERIPPREPNLVIAPADGKVIFVGEVDEERYLGRRMLKVSIFMNVFNVHVNRMPETGTITEIRYNPGKYVNASFDKASLDNEQNALVMKTDDGVEIAFVQIAGLVARRIVCWVKPGDRLERGERFGLIMFGSRVDIYMPAGTDPKIKAGDKTVAGETSIGALR
jgi:phosphatidylserine decarboxylase